ncbi:MAG: Gfo/Idh/MocA family oxidoreductase [Lachnospiraceae bacterium]|jgi:predicted dehydrogenase|nr:Gfo/Idh/MocA family oxidoreductase [Lachnospiraceae bacterium]
MEKIKWGVLGTAYIFERDMARGMSLAHNCEQVAIAGRSLEKAKEFQEKYGFLRAYGSYQELLEDEEIEAVYIPLPNTMHYEWTIKALQKGKHVLCEKPLAPSAAQAREMFQAAQENHVFLMEAFAYQHSPYIKEIRRVIEEGQIGEVRYAEAALITSDYDHSNIRMRKGTLGGCTYDLGVYALSFLQRMMGTAPANIHALSSISEEGIDTYTTAILEYEHGTKGHIDCGMVLETEKNAALDRFQIHGSRGSVTSVDFGFNMPGTLSYRLRTFQGMDELRKVEVPNNYCLEVEQLGRCIRNGETPYVSAEFSVALAETVDRVLETIGY